jgi:uncharacterized protein (TIGR01777 family)
MKIILAGGTGFIGQSLTRSLEGKGYEVTILTRSRSQDPHAIFVAEYSGDALTGALRGSDAVINLAGSNIGSQRWTRKRKAELVHSRLSTTSAIVSAISLLKEDERPKVLVNASGIDYYGNRGEEVIDEESASGTTFLAELCAQWEEAAQRAGVLGVRVVQIRTATVVGPGAQSIKLRLLPFRFHVGGAFRPGTQWFCWIHLEDLIGIYQLAIEQEELHGALNAVSPGILREVEAARVFGRAANSLSWLHIPQVLSRIALGERADLLLHGRYAKSVKVSNAKFEFKFLTLSQALDDR